MKALGGFPGFPQIILASMDLLNLSSGEGGCQRRGGEHLLGCESPWGESPCWRVLGHSRSSAWQKAASPGTHWGGEIFPNQAMPDSGPSRVRTHDVRGDPLTREGAPRAHQEEMGDGPVFGLSAEQVAHIRPLISQGTGCERVDDRKVLSGIIHVTQKGLRWLAAPAAGRWSPQNPRQPLPPLVRQGCF